ncbi:hypothetical protein [Lysobacter gummosus]|uniref:hypothetical protein n=1 Tax=Lysobacter gummosus TaxID=262324 RepID=UPI00362D261C
MDRALADVRSLADGDADLVAAAVLGSAVQTRYGALSGHRGRPGGFRSHIGRDALRKCGGLSEDDSLAIRRFTSWPCLPVSYCVRSRPATTPPRRPSSVR